MTIQRERLNRKNASGEYDTIHLETQADLVLMASDPSKNVEQVLGETVAIAKGGTGATTAAAGLYNLMAGLTEMTAEELAEDDLLCVLDVDTNSAKKVALSVVGIGGGGTTNPELPDKGSLTLGNTVTFADKQWIVSHVTNTEAYLTLSGLSGQSTWYNLQNACANFIVNQLTDAQKNCLKSVIAGNTSGKVFVATKDQMDGGFSYFNNDGPRSIGSSYWTSSEVTTSLAWLVESNGHISDIDYIKSYSYGFRPSVCIDLTLYDSGDSGGSEEPVTNPNWPNKSDLVVGNTINWAGHDWIVSHIVVTDQDVSNVKAVEAYLTLSDLLGRYTWNYLQDACTTFANSSLTEAQRGCLKSVTAGNTSGKVFVATYGQMDGGFSYFNSNSRRRLRSIYWTSSECDEVDAWRVDSFGSCNYTDKSTSYGFRPSVCVDLTLYDSGNSGGSDVPTKDDFTVGETISFAGKQWIVAHITDTEVYLAYPTTISTGTWLNLQDPCMEFSNELTGEDKEHLKYIQTERTSGIVFIPSVGQLSYSGSPMDTYGFEYFNCDSRRAIGERYWTSTEYTQSSADNLAYFIDDDGSIQADLYNTNQFDELGIRPFVCIDLTSYT